MVRKSSTYAIVIPCLNTQVIKTQSIRRIESILREGLETIEEEGPMTPSPSPGAAALAEAAMNGRQIQRKMSLQKRTVSARLQKARAAGGSGAGAPRRWRVRISRFSTVISAPLSTLGDSYVRMMNGFADRGGPLLGELAAFHTSSDTPLLDNQSAF